MAAMLVAALLLVSCEEKTVLEPEFKLVSETEITVPAEGDTYSAVVSSSANWTLSGGVSWCEPSKTSGSNGETVTFTVEPNTTVSERNVTYTFRCGDKTTKLTITQKQKDALTVTQSKYEVKAEGDDIEIEIKANIPFDYEIEQR